MDKKAFIKINNSSEIDENDLSNFRKTAFFGKNVNPLKVINNSIIKKGYELDLNIEDFNFLKVDKILHSTNSFLKDLDDTINNNEFNSEFLCLTSYENINLRKIDSNSDLKEILDNEDDLDLCYNELELEFEELEMEIKESEKEITKISTLKKLLLNENELLEEKNKLLHLSNEKLDNQNSKNLQEFQKNFFNKSIIPEAKKANKMIFSLISNLNNKEFLISNNNKLFDFSQIASSFKETFIKLNEFELKVNESFEIINLEYINQFCFTINTILEIEKQIILNDLIVKKSSIKNNLMQYLLANSSNTAESFKKIETELNNLKNEKNTKIVDLNIHIDNEIQKFIENKIRSKEKFLCEIKIDEISAIFNNINNLLIKDNTLLELFLKGNYLMIKNISITKIFLNKDKNYSQNIFDLMIELMQFYHTNSETVNQEYLKECQNDLLIGDINTNKLKSDISYSVLRFNKNKNVLDGRDLLMNFICKTYESYGLLINFNNENVINLDEISILTDEFVCKTNLFADFEKFNTKNLVSIIKLNVFHKSLGIIKSMIYKMGFRISEEAKKLLEYLYNKVINISNKIK